MRKKTLRKLTFFIFTMLITASLLSGCTGKKQEQQEGKSETKEVNKVVSLTQTPPPNMLNQLKAKEIDGFIAWEPFNITAVQEGYGKYLFKSADIWQNHPCCVLAASQNFKDAQTVTAVTWAHIQATRFINDPKNIDKVNKYTAEFTGKSPEIVKEALKNIAFVEYPAEDKFKEYYNSLEKDKLLKKSVSDLGYPDKEKFFAGFLQNSTFKDIEAKLAQDPDWTPASVPAGTKLRLGYLQAVDHLALYVAEKEGYYQKVGLVPGGTLETKLFANGVAVMEAFKVKDIDMAYVGGAPATLKRVNDNIPIVVVAGVNDEGSGMIVRSDETINTIADLGGKTIATPGVGTVQYTLLQKALQEKGMTSVVK